jgi:hypothetical protein
LKDHGIFSATDGIFSLTAGFFSATDGIFSLTARFFSATDGIFSLTAGFFSIEDRFSAQKSYRISKILRLYPVYHREEPKKAL